MIAIYIIQLTCQLRLFTADRHRQMHQSDILDDTEWSSPRKVGFWRTQITIQPSSMAGEIKMQNLKENTSFLP